MTKEVKDALEFAAIVQAHPHIAAKNKGYGKAVATLGKEVMRLLELQKHCSKNENNTRKILTSIKK